jgi:hypothetical protein
MSAGDELLLLRLLLLAIVFVFVVVVAFTLRAGLGSRGGSPVRAREPARTAAKLTVRRPAESGLPAGAAFVLGGTMTIGRDADNGIVLADASVSSHHASLERTASGWRVVDLGSTNGTFVNGRPIDGRGVFLRGGEDVALGAVVLRFQP